jgi:dTDP-4-amino-4,6-dideoxygalactose transaminase
MDEINAVAARQGLWVIEDCAQAHGASYRGRPVGSLGHLAAFSFCQDKILTTGGEGGLLVMDDDGLHERAWAFKDHGKSRRKVMETGHPPLFRWLHDDFGTNLRMTEMQAAIGRLMLQRLPAWVEQRRHHAAALDAALAGVPGIEVIAYPDHCEPAFYKYYALLDLTALAAGWTRDAVILAIQAEGIPCGLGSCPEIYREAAFANRGFSPAERLPGAQALGERTLMFQVHPTLEANEVEATAAAISKVLAVATSQSRLDGRSWVA